MFVTLPNINRKRVKTRSTGAPHAVDVANRQTQARSDDPQAGDVRDEAIF